VYWAIKFGMISNHGEKKSTKWSILNLQDTALLGYSRCDAMHAFLLVQRTTKPVTYWWQIVLRKTEIVVCQVALFHQDGLDDALASLLPMHKFSWCIRFNSNADNGRFPNVCITYQTLSQGKSLQCQGQEMTSNAKAKDLTPWQKVTVQFDAAI